MLRFTLNLQDVGNRIDLLIDNKIIIEIKSGFYNAIEEIRKAIDVKFLKNLLEK